MFETLAEIEAVCGRVATQRATSIALEQLAAANGLCMQAIAAGNADASARHNDEFHQLIYRSSGNDFLAAQAWRLCDGLRSYRRVQVQIHSRMMQSMGEHQSLMAALAERPAVDAADILRDHVGTQGERFYQQMGDVRRTATIR